MHDTDGSAATPRGRAHGVATLLVAAALFGVMAVCVRAASQQMPAVQIVFVRFAGSFLFMLAATRGAGLAPRPGNAGRLVLRGLLGAVAITFYFLGIEGAGAGLATLVQNSYPVFAALLAVLLRDEVFTPRLAGALALSACGAVIVLGARVDLASATTLGVLAALLAAVLSGCAVVTAQQLRRSEGAAIVTTWFMGVGALVTAPGLVAGLPAIDARLALLLAGVIVTSVVAQWLLHHGLGFTSATQGSITAATSVFVAAALEALALGDVPDPRILPGGALMLAAVALAWRRSVPATRQLEPSRDAGVAPLER